MNKAILSRNLRKLHLWFGIGIGLQLGLWLISGLFMTLFPIDQVRGTHLRAEHAPQIVSPNLDVLGPADIVSKHTLRPQSLTLKMLNEQPVYIVTSEDQTQVFDAKTCLLYTSPSPRDS